MEQVLSVENLSVSFDTKDGIVQAVRDISLQVNKGETLAVVGESGCGKSVFCRSVLKLLPDTAKITGKILIKTHCMLFRPSQLSALRQQILFIICNRFLTIAF